MKSIGIIERYCYSQHYDYNISFTMILYYYFTICKTQFHKINRIFGFCGNQLSGYPNQIIRIFKISKHIPTLIYNVSDVILNYYN